MARLTRLLAAALVVALCFAPAAAGVPPAPDGPPRSHGHDNGTATATPTPTGTPTPTATPTPPGTLTFPSTPPQTPTATPPPAANRVTVPLRDAEPRGAGVTVEFTGAPLRRVTLANDSLAGAGELSVTTYEAPPSPIAANYRPEDVVMSVEVVASLDGTNERARLEFVFPRSTFDDSDPQAYRVVTVNGGVVQSVVSNVQVRESEVVITAATTSLGEFAVVRVDSSFLGGASTPASTDTRVTPTRDEGLPPTLVAVGIGVLGLAVTVVVRVWRDWL